MNLTDKLNLKPLAKVGIALIAAGIFSFGIYNCVNGICNLEKQAENYLENTFSAYSYFGN